jgi:hypothetical protein
MLGIRYKMGGGIVGKRVIGRCLGWFSWAGNSRLSTGPSGARVGGISHPKQAPFGPILKQSLESSQMRMIQNGYVTIERRRLVAQEVHSAPKADHQHL